LGSILGQTSKVTVGADVTAEGAVMGTGETVDQVVALSRNGYRFQASVGLDSIKDREVGEDETVEVNGRTIQGPFDWCNLSLLTSFSSALSATSLAPFQLGLQNIKLNVNPSLFSAVARNFISWFLFLADV
jgi:hypothetical protein